MVSARSHPRRITGFMYPRWLLATILLGLFPFLLHNRSIAQVPGEPLQNPSTDSPANPVMPGQHEPLLPERSNLPSDEHESPPLMRIDQRDPIIRLGELRDAIRTDPHDGDTRLKLAEGLYQFGDLDAAIDECRVAIKINQDDAKAHLQLGVILIAKQDWRAASSVLKEAIRLDPTLTRAYYSLGNVQYSLGNVTAAIQSYRRALELQPYFPDARYRLALLLKLTKNYEEAAQFLEGAAVGGVPHAQFFLGNAYKNGQGVERNLGQAVFWWTRAAESGYQPATDVLSKLRRQALSTNQPEPQRRAALDAFQAYREKLWDEFPDLIRNGEGGTVGTTLLEWHRGNDAVRTLLRECYALSDVALAELARLYESGWGLEFPPYDKTIFTCVETTAAEGFVPAKKVLARIYGKGIGMEPDLLKAKAALDGLSKQEIRSVLAQLNAS